MKLSYRRTNPRTWTVLEVQYWAIPSTGMKNQACKPNFNIDANAKQSYLNKEFFLTLLGLPCVEMFSLAHIVNEILQRWLTCFIKFSFISYKTVLLLDFFSSNWCFIMFIFFMTRENNIYMFFLMQKGKKKI